MMVLAHLRKGETYRDLAVGFGVGTTTAYRYLREALSVLAAQAPSLEQAMQTAAAKAYVILDGTVVRIDRVAMASRRDRAYCRVGTGRGAGVATGPFPRAARRTRRAILTAPGSPRSGAVQAGLRVQGVGIVSPR